MCWRIIRNTLRLINVLHYYLKSRIMRCLVFNMQVKNEYKQMWSSEWNFNNNALLKKKWNLCNRNNICSGKKSIVNYRLGLIGPKWPRDSIHFILQWTIIDRFSLLLLRSKRHRNLKLFIVYTHAFTHTNVQKHTPT